MIQSIDAPSIYEVPLLMHSEGLDRIVLRTVGLPSDGDPDLGPWNDFLTRLKTAGEEIRIGLVGKYVELQDAYKSINEALMQAATYCGHKLKLIYVHSEKLDKGNVDEKLGSLDGVVVAPGFGHRGIEGKFVALEWCRTHDVPTFGICLGHQLSALAAGAKTMKLKYGHRGANQPVTDFESGRTFITSQNHGYAVVGEELPAEMGEVAQVNANDGTCEGIKYKKWNCFTVQFHPEANGGPKDTEFLFDRFLNNVKAAKKEVR